MRLRLFTSLYRPPMGALQDVLSENRKLIKTIERRSFLRGSLSLGALTLLSGCAVSNDGNIQATLRAMSA